MKRTVWRVVFVVALVVFVASVTMLVLIGASYWEGQQKYDDVAVTAGMAVPDEPEKQPDGASVDWDALRAINGDTVAWLYVPNTSINYPVVQGADNQHYLTHDFDGAQGWLAEYGCVFMDYRNNPDWSDAAHFFYGHHMNDGSMFADLAGFAAQERFDACRTLYVLSPNGDFRLRTFAFVHASADDKLVQTQFATEEERQVFLQQAIEASLVQCADIPPVAQMPTVFVLATCDNLREDGRYLLYAYVEQTTAEGLSGALGVGVADGSPVGFEDTLTTGGNAQ